MKSISNCLAMTIGLLAAAGLAACGCGNNGYYGSCNVYYPGPGPGPGASDGANPNGLVQGTDGNYYGTTANGGANGLGSFFRVTPAGVETVLYSFGGGNGDGADPEGIIQGSDGNFYGATNFGGGGACSFGCGVVFRITPAGLETVLYSFSGGADGGDPNGVVEGTDGNFYGTAAYGGITNGACGPTGCGVVFRLTPAGVESVVYAFPGGVRGVQPVSLIQGNDGNFYGTTVYGGTSNYGTVFRVSAAGAQTVLHSFTGGSDGQLPQQTQLLQGSDGNFYGTTPYGGVASGGVVYRITPAGAETVLHAFGGGTGDGALPYTALVQGPGSTLYGATNAGGNSGCAGGCGVVYRLTLAGNESVFSAFAPGANTGGQPPNPSVVLLPGPGPAGNPTPATQFIAGTTSAGGQNGIGSVFTLTSSGAATTLYSFGTNGP